MQFSLYNFLSPTVIGLADLRSLPQSTPPVRSEALGPSGHLGLHISRRPVITTEVTQVTLEVHNMVRVCLDHDLRDCVAWP